MHNQKFSCESPSNVSKSNVDSPTKDQFQQKPPLKVNFHSRHKRKEIKKIRYLFKLFITENCEEDKWNWEFNKLNVPFRISFQKGKG